MALDTNKFANDAKEQFNILMGNMAKFADEDMAGYNECYNKVFQNGVTTSYMSATFYAQFSAEILIGCISSNPFRKMLIEALDSEKAVAGGPVEYWEPSMEQNRFGIEGRDYENDIKDLTAMMNESYTKISALNEWFGTEEGKKEFDMYCLSRKAIRDIKRIVCEYPYLISKYDHDKDFASEIMEYAGIVAQQIVQFAEGNQ